MSLLIYGLLALFQVVNAGGRLTGVGVGVTITSPTSAATYDAGTAFSVDMAGTAISDRRITLCSYSSTAGSGVMVGTNSWVSLGVSLTVGTNAITVTCTNELGAAGTDVITITRSASGGSTVTSSSLLSWDAANLTNVYGYKVQVDALTPVDVGIPTTQAPHVSSGGVTFTIIASALSMTNGAHTLTFCAYNNNSTSSTSCPTLSVTKQ